jgi:putative intracellular protease/amidase
MNDGKAVTMKVAILVSPKDFKDESLSKVKLMLDKWGVQSVLTSYSTHELVGYHGAVYNADMNAAKIVPDEFDAIILIDGKGVEEYKLYDFRQLLDTMKLFSMKGKLIASIGNATKIIARSNIIANTKIAVPKDEDTRRLVVLYHGTPSSEALEFDKNILTLGNNERILDFSNLLLKKLGAM